MSRRNFRREIREPTKISSSGGLKTLATVRKSGPVFEGDRSVPPTTVADGWKPSVRPPTGVAAAIRRATGTETRRRRGWWPVRLTSLFSCASADLNVRLIHSFTSKLSSENAATSWNGHFEVRNLPAVPAARSRAAKFASENRASRAGRIQRRSRP